MKRILSFALVLILIIASFSACEKTSGLYYDYDMSKYVSLGKYVKTVDRKSEDYAKSKVKFHEQTFGSNLSSNEITASFSASLRIDAIPILLTAKLL